MLTNRRHLGEFLGTALLVMAVVGSGIMAQNMSDDAGVQLLANAIATGGALFALITIFGPVSGASFNPLVSIIGYIRNKSSITELFADIVAQTLGAISGCILANAMFGLATLQTSTRIRSGGPLWLSETVATATLIVIIFAAIETQQSHKIAALVAGWITGAYWFTSSTSLANPAVTVGRMFSDSFAGIAPRSTPMFVVMQILGAVVGWGLIRAIWQERK
ncbi:MAG: aquaporin family protein [Ilumatobacteraceae bacterium]|nr:aquaporin family protein [Ilumatobacteraceae bacterium]